MGKRKKDIYQYKTKLEVAWLNIKRFFKRLMILSIIGLVIWGVFEMGAYANPKTVYTKQEVIKEVEAKLPLLDRIAKCESKGTHYGPNGQVLVRGNNNKTVDIGKYQINSYYWGQKATDMGLNLWVEEDNETMAIWIMKNYGSEPWSATKSCWSK